MKILFLGIGKTKHKFLEEGIKKYFKQSSPFCKIEEKYLKEEATKPNCIDLESEKIIKNIPKGYYTILLDLKGKNISSEDLALKIQEVQGMGVSGVVFIIGGHSGVNDEVRKAADFRWQISNLTFTHQMIRLILSEQIYRAYSIIHNKKYHK